MISAGKYIQVSSTNINQRILILDSSRGTVGITVEQAGEILLVKPDNINIKSDASKNVVGTILYRDNLVILLERP